MSDETPRTGPTSSEPPSQDGHNGDPDWDAIDHDVLCPLCEYNLRGLPAPRCPECGYHFEWPEVLDPKRKLHPYLFEHHPERNVRSYIRTEMGTWLPGRFWRSLNPAQPSSRKRLIIYWCIGAILYGMVMASIPVAMAIEQVVEYRAQRQQYIQQRKQRIQQIKTATAPRMVQYRNSLIQQFGSVEKAVSVGWPTGTIRGQLRNLFRINETFTILIVAPLVPLAWPWITFLALMIFRISMRRARIKTTHVLRCIIYSYDHMFWMAFPTLCLLATTVILTAQNTRTNRNVWPTTSPWLGYDEAFLIIYWAWFAVGLIAIYRLWRAYRHYLRFDHALGTVLAAQIITTLVIFKVFLLFIFGV